MLLTFQLTASTEHYFPLILLAHTLEILLEKLPSREQILGIQAYFNSIRTNMKRENHDLGFFDYETESRERGIAVIRQG